MVHIVFALFYCQPDHLVGLRVAQVRTIFTLPDHLNTSRLPKKLVYIEWFSAFRAPDPISRRYSVSRSVRQHSPVATIIPLTDIVATCHLAPKYGTRFGSTGTWTHDTALEVCPSFTLNTDIDISTWYEHERHVFSSYT
jgi:hypothetical protein